MKAEAMSIWNAVLSKAATHGADELVFAIGRVPSMRRGTDIITLGREALRADQTQALVEEITPPLLYRRLVATGHAVFDHRVPEGVIFEVECHRFKGRVGVVMRRAPQSLPHSGTIEEE